MQSFVFVPLLVPLLCLQAAVVAPPWADPSRNPCASRPGGWQLLHWPADNQCYRIFTRGSPCPETMELGPGVGGGAECRCPPYTALSPRDAKCHTLFMEGPCVKGQYFAPVPGKTLAIRQSIHRWGTCRDIESCPTNDQLFWAKDGNCYARHSRGPCPKGQLLDITPSGLSECKCKPDGPLASYYWPPTETCHEHYTRGPCEQKGHLFLPGRQCGCHEGLPNYHQQTGLCYQIGGLVPCPPGHQFLLPPHDDNDNNNNNNNNNNATTATCQCKKGLILWPDDGACYRLYTRGPCPHGQILFNSTTCALIPCRHGRLYFPDISACYKVGTQGPCPDGQLVLFESVRISVDGISHKGTCGCDGPNEKCVKEPSEKVTSNTNVSSNVNVVCDMISGLVKWNNQCYKLYTQGPCLSGEWLVPERDGRQWDEFGRKRRQKARCECKPGYKMLKMGNSTDIEQCQSPTVVLARFLNMNSEPHPII